MKQVIQDLGDGQTSIVNVPIPNLKPGYVLINTEVSLISSGTERMLVDFGKSNLIKKARAQPEKVSQAFEKIKTDGVFATIAAIRSKLGQPIPLGYCNVGTVYESCTEEFKIGDRVVSNGPHAEVVSVPRNLCAKIPDDVSNEMASFTIVASIGLQGIRLAQPTIGECFVVIGVGLIGLLTVQLLLAQGCRVLAIDLDPSKLEIAKSFGAKICNPGASNDPVAASIAFSRSEGVDGVIITASTKSNDPITQAARMCRKRGRIILVGVTGLKLNRSDFYEKELTFQVSCSYGPGRYDNLYENRGNDYPLGFVRWTEQRNFVAILDLMSSGFLDIKPLITHRKPFEQAPKAYEILTSDKSAIGIMLSYSHSTQKKHIRSVALSTNNIIPKKKNIVAFIGAGNYASRFLIPAFKSAGAILHTIVSSGGTSSVINGRSAGFSYATSDTNDIFSSDKINTVAIVTRHDSHANLTVKALNAGKHVFVEKPLALTLQELKEVEVAYSQSNCHLMVGFNRRFSPLIKTMKELLASVLEPSSFVMVMNAGAIPFEHWTQDSLIGGGRIIGEACHYIDLMRYLVGAPIVSMQARRMGRSDSLKITDDKAVIVLGFADGSFGTIHYLANGGSSFPKERIEVFSGGRTLQLDNFIKLKGYNWPGFKKQNLWRQDKGQYACVDAFLKSIKTGSPFLIPPDELFEVARITIEAADLIRAQK